MQLENALMTADTSADELKSVVSAYPEMDADRLAVQLVMLRQQNWKLESVEDVATKLASAQPVVRSTFDQVEQLVKLLLTIPCSSAEAERSFSSLRRLKTYLLAKLNESTLNSGSITWLFCMYIARDWMALTSMS